MPPRRTATIVPLVAVALSAAGVAAARRDAERAAPREGAFLAPVGAGRPVHPGGADRAGARTRARAVPEPAGLPLLGAGLALLALARRRAAREALLLAAAT